MIPTYHIVSHSHWDREWYKSFEQFRAMLVNMIDDLLDLLRRDGEFRHFTLDGQTVVLEDYLAVRPGKREEIRRLVGEGRLVTGPWYVLPDEFLVSGESTVRNLMAGTRMAASFGGTMTVGYIPDSFGHIAMMPAILRGFGIGAALVYRGFGGEPGEQTSEYWWEAPDGTRTLLVHLFRHGYSAGYFHQETDAQIIGRFAPLKEELDRRATTSHRLLMNGGDHHWPDPNLPATLTLLRKSFEGTFEHSTVEHYVDAVREEISGIPPGNGGTGKSEIPVVEGELRFGYRYAFAVLGGVYSSRMYIKQANWKSEMLLERYAEPLNALACAAGGHSQSPLLRHAWATLMKNHPHDSICGCSIDPVHREMMTRFAAVQDIGGSVVDASLDHILPNDDMATGDDRYLFLFNPSPFARTEIAEAEVCFFRRDVVVGLNPDVVVDPELPPVRSLALLDASGAEVPFQLLRHAGGYDITYSHYNYPRQTFADRFSILVDAKDVPPLGFRGFRIEKRKKLTAAVPGVKAGRDFIENRFLRVSVNSRGAMTLYDKTGGERYAGLNIFEDSGDVGDEYNYSYPARDAVVRSGKTRARVTALERGPLRARLRVQATLRIPASAAPDRKSRSKRTVAIPITTRVTLGAYSHFVECETTVDNRARDHRLRVLFPAGIRTDRVRADSQFCIVERVQRKYDVRSFTIEHPAQVAPMQRFVTVRGRERSLTLLAYGLPEYELKLDGKGTLALTLLRCVGKLAGDDLITRPGGKAGWDNETPDAQCQGVHTFRYALLPHGPEEPDWGEFVGRESERFHLPVLPLRRKNTAPLPLESSLLGLEGGPLVLSALKESEDGTGIIVRVYNPGPAGVEGVLRCARPVKKALLVNLNEEVTGEVDVTGDSRGASLRLDVPAGGIATVCIRLQKKDRMTHTLSVQRNLELLGRYQYIEIQMMELMGSWAYTIVDPEIKIAFGRQMYQDAVHADLLGKRIPELKGRSAHFHAIPPSDGVVRFFETVWKAEGDLKRMVGLYRLVKPALIEAYRSHIASAELPADEPTAYILRHIADEETDHCAWAEKIISRLPADPLTAEWERDLTRDLRGAGPAAAGGGGPFAGSGTGGATYSFTKVHDYSLLPVRDSRWDIIADPGGFTEKNWSFDTQDGKQHLLHDLLNSEFITVERMGRILADFPGIPWQMKLDMARQAWDEARHAEIVQKRLEELGGHVGMFKTSCWGWEQDVNRPDPLERLALSNMTFESESCKHLRDWIRKAKEGGDDRSVQLLEFLLADEVNHVLYGIHWIDELTRDDPGRRKRVLAYPNQVLEGQHPVGVRFNETINIKGIGELRNPVRWR